MLKGWGGCGVESLRWLWCCWTCLLQQPVSHVGTGRLSTACLSVCLLTPGSLCPSETTGKERSDSSRPGGGGRIGGGSLMCLHVDSWKAVHQSHTGFPAGCSERGKSPLLVQTKLISTGGGGTTSSALWWVWMRSLQQGVCPHPPPPSSCLIELWLR